MGISAIFPHATLVKLEGTVSMGPWCGVEAKPLDITVENSAFFGQLRYSTLGLERPNGRLGDSTLELIVA